MCGIAGIFSFGADGPDVSGEELLRIRDSMMSRGPDGAGIWLSNDKKIGLAHRRLSILDLSDAGAQPMRLRDDYVVAFNGEIYNYHSLRDKLEKRGCQFRSTTDTEVLLHLYAEHGADMVSMLRGMYAFAIWDNVRGGIFLCRDTFGIKPLYFSDDGTVLRFASQVKALLRSSQLDTREDAAGHAGFFLWGYVPEPYTLYKSIRALPAGTNLWIDKKGRHVAGRATSISDIFMSAGDNPLYLSPMERHERLRHALSNSVQSHMIADVPVGVFLSSGLDSATILGLASESGETLRSITLGFKEYVGSENDEVPLARKIAERYGADNQAKWISKVDFQGAIQPFIASMDQPSIDGLNTYFVSKVAADSGLKVALSGLGGDEIFGGYPSFSDVPQIVKWCSIGKMYPLFGRTFRRITSNILRHFTSSKYAGLFEYGGSHGGAYLLRRGLFMPWELPEIMDADFAREGWNELQPLVSLNDLIHGLTDTHMIVSTLELSSYMRGQLLRDADWAGMASSLEIRVPFVDLDLLREIAPMIVPGAPTKRDMAMTPRRSLPSEILSRPKTGFTVPVREWAIESLKNTAQDRGLRGWAKIVYEEYGARDNLIR